MSTIKDNFSGNGDGSGFGSGAGEVLKPVSETVTVAADATVNAVSG